MKLMDSLGKVNNELGVVVKFIFDSNYEKVFPLTIESLDLICAFSDEGVHGRTLSWGLHLRRQVQTRLVE